MNIEGVQERIIMLFGPKCKKILQLKKDVRDVGFMPGSLRQASWSMLFSSSSFSVQAIEFLISSFRVSFRIFRVFI